MPTDAGSIYSAVRIKLNELQADINNAESALDDFGKVIVAQAAVTSDKLTKKYAESYQNIAAQVKSVAVLVEKGALTEQEGIKRTLKLKQQELKLIQDRAVKEGTASTATIAAIGNVRTAIADLQQQQVLLKTEQEKTSQGFLTNLPKVASNVFYVIRSIRLVIGVIQDMVRPLKEAEQAWMDQEEAANKVISVFNSTGAAAWTTEKHILDLASSLSKVTKYSDQEIESMQAVLLGFTKIQGINFDQATEAVLNVATVMKYDLTSSAQAVGKALEYPSKMLDGLRRQGFKFTDQQMSMIKAFEAAGQIEKAQAIILEELTRAYGGAARAVGEADSQLKTMKDKSIKELKEEIGRAISSSGWLIGWRKAIKDIADRLYEATKHQNDLNDAVKRSKELKGGAEVAPLTVDEKVLVAEAELAAAQKKRFQLASEGLSEQSKLILEAYDAEIAVLQQRLNLQKAANLASKRAAESTSKDARTKAKAEADAADAAFKAAEREADFAKSKSEALANYQAQLAEAKNLHLDDFEFNKKMSSAADATVEALAKLSGIYPELWGSKNQALLDAWIEKQKTYSQLVLSDADVLDAENDKLKQKNSIIDAYNKAIGDIAIKQSTISDFTPLQAAQETKEATESAIIEISRFINEFGNADEEVMTFFNNLRKAQALSGSIISSEQVDATFEEIGKTFAKAKAIAQSVYDIKGDPEEFNKALLSATTAQVDSLALLKFTAENFWTDVGETALSEAIKSEKALTSLVSGAEFQKYKIKKDYSEAYQEIKDKEDSGELSTADAIEERASLIKSTLDLTRNFLKEFDRFDMDMLAFKDTLSTEFINLGQVAFDAEYAARMAEDSGDEYADSVEENTKRIEKYFDDRNKYIADSEEDLTKDINDEKDMRRKVMLEAVLAEVKAAFSAGKEITDIEAAKNATIKSFDTSAWIQKQYEDIVASAKYSTDQQIEDFKEIQDGVAKTSQEWQWLQEIINQLNLDKAKKEFSDLVSNVDTVWSQIEDAIGSFTDIFTEGISDQIDALTEYYDKQRELLENDGKTKREALEAELADAIANNDEEAKAEAEKNLALYDLDEEYEKKKLQLQYEADLAEYQSNIVTAAGDVAMSILKALSSSAPPWNFIMAGLSGAAGAVQMAALVAAKPNAPSAATGGIVLPSGGGGLVNVAENGSPELLLNDSAIGDAVLSAFADKIASKINAAGGGTVTVPIYLDGKLLAQSTVKRINNGEVRLTAK
jgi:hypothetical protein